MKGISILGSTGSIGCNTLKVIEHLGDIRVVAMAAGRNMPKFAGQIAQFKPAIVSCDDEECAENLTRELHALGVQPPKIELNTRGLGTVATHPEAEKVLLAAGGRAGLGPH